VEECFPAKEEVVGSNPIVATMSNEFIEQEFVRAERALDEGRIKHYEEMMANIYQAEGWMLESWRLEYERSNPA
jgi:hypothetical protein